MRIASHSVTALGADTGWFNQPTGGRLACVRGYVGSPMPVDRAEPSSISKPE
jgi:hypothetical protein